MRLSFRTGGIRTGMPPAAKMASIYPAFKRAYGSRVADGDVVGVHADQGSRLRRGGGLFLGLLDTSGGHAKRSLRGPRGWGIMPRMASRGRESVSSEESQKQAQFARSRGLLDKEWIE